MTAKQIAVKKYVVRLSDEEREHLNTLTRPPIAKHGVALWHFIRGANFRSWSAQARS